MKSFFEVDDVLLDVWIYFGEVASNFSRMSPPLPTSSRRRSTMSLKFIIDFIGFLDKYYNISKMYHNMWMSFFVAVDHWSIIHWPFLSFFWRCIPVIIYNYPFISKWLCSVSNQILINTCIEDRRERWRVEVRSQIIYILWTGSSSKYFNMFYYGWS